MGGGGGGVGRERERERDEEMNGRRSEDWRRHSLTDSPTSPGGPGGPTAPSGPCKNYGIAFLHFFLQGVTYE